MFNRDVFVCIGLTSDQSLKLVEYAATKICGSAGRYWWGEYGYWIKKGEPALGYDCISDSLNKIWWNLVTLENYNESIGDGPLSQEEIDKKRQEFPMTEHEIKKLKQAIFEC